MSSSQRNSNGKCQLVIDNFFSKSKARPGKGSLKKELEESTNTDSRDLVSSVKENLRISFSESGDGRFARDDDGQSFSESPKKKARINSRFLQERCSRGPIRRIGDIFKLIEVHGNGNVKSGKAKQVFLKCVVTENLSGRVKEGMTNMKRDGFRFIYLADYTGFISIGMHSTETGVIKYDVPIQDCRDDTTCSFSAIVEGSVEWIAKRGSQNNPVFFLKNGYVRKIETIDWNDGNRLMFPTSDVCLKMTESKYAAAAKFSTAGICGRVDVMSESNVGDLLLSLEDPVGYVAVQLKIDEQGQTARAFREREKIQERGYVFIKGSSGVLDIDTFRAGKNVLLKGKISQVEVMVVEKSRYDEYVKLLMGTNGESFRGFRPEKM